MWQAFRNEVHGDGIEIVTVGIDTAGAEACRHFIEAAKPEHPSLIDANHRVAELFGVINIPNGVWIDEAGMIVRPAEPAPAPPSLNVERSANLRDMTDVPARMVEILGEASKIEVNAPAYEEALRDWIAHGAESRFALDADEVIERSGPRSSDAARGHAHFELATHLEQLGDHQAAIVHFRAAQELVPENFAYRRQAWSLEPGAAGRLARFWQGPAVGSEGDWPYAGDWLTDVRKMGAANYYPSWSA